ncbi:N-acyl homoserine lactonase AiiA [bacterium HR29]|jgi:glyoxylase-like metal-dependent hydrolase (beta-lactamase superfamily II)|nr:N-acyl homoserine lactonase AiiA [bacterium HR29]
MRVVRIGSVEVLPLVDTYLLGDPRIFMPKHAEAFLGEYPHLLDERGLLRMTITCFLVRSAGKTWLVDTGIGPRRRPNFPAGKLDQALREAGLGPADIDGVIHTHLHIDHVGWNTVPGPDGAPQPYFPRAEHRAQRAEWQFWMRPEHLEGDAQPHLAECVAPVADRFRLQDGEEAIDDHLVFVPAPGHTPGHVAIGIASQGERALIVGDASHHPVQLDHPDWSPAFDVDPDLAARTRARLFDDAASDGRVWMAGHWPDSGIGRIVRVDGRRVFRAL